MRKVSITARLAVVAAAMTVTLLVMVAVKQYTLATGTLVDLETRPVDPRSLFRGDYVRLRYAISLLDLKKLGGDTDFSRGDVIYVVLKPGDPFWTAVSVHHAYPVAKPGQVVIKGRVGEHWRFGGGQLDVTYGIENYFVPEGQGHDLEDPSKVGRISIVVAVDRFGNAGIRQVLEDGKPRFTESLF
ncbi:MAG TPA: GDYXXLXY domain-containing protein [Alphaproteobacteria bacterium]|nr:GDYXXLXY domain-containing protein [Alphaproteobacteria bacterium]